MERSLFMLRGVMNVRVWTGGQPRWIVAALLAAVSLIAATSQTIAHEAHGHPARIHEGTCEELGPVAYRLNGVGGSVDLDNAPVATPTAVNPESAYQVMVSDTTIDGTMDDLLASDHAVMIYESDEEMQVIACGQIGGAMSGDTLIAGLAEMGVPGHLGFALFHPNGEGLDVSLIIGHAMAPVSASGAQPDHEHSDDADADHEHADDEAAHDHEAEDETHDDDDAAATPEA
jgi:hypothetical protein